MSENKLPYSVTRVHDGVIYVSGQLPRDPETGEMAEGIEAQTKVCLENLARAVEQAGGSRASVLKVTVFLRDFADFGAMNAVYREFFAEPYPARSAFGVSGLVEGALLEIEAVAAVE